MAFGLLLTGLIEPKFWFCFITVDVNRLDEEGNTALHIIAKYTHELYRGKDIQEGKTDIQQTQVLYIFSTSYMAFN